MKITEALTHSTAAGDAGNATTVAPAQQVLAGGYVTIIVIVAVVIFLVVGLAVYKTCTVTWVSFRTTGRRRHESGRWLTSDNPLMWDDEAPYDLIKEKGKFGNKEQAAAFTSSMGLGINHGRSGRGYATGFSLQMIRDCCDGISNTAVRQRDISTSSLMRYQL